MPRPAALYIGAVNAVLSANAGTGRSHVLWIHSIPVHIETMAPDQYNPLGFRASDPD
jgi:hypothetical protein